MPTMRACRRAPAGASTAHYVPLHGYTPRPEHRSTPQGAPSQSKQEDGVDENFLRDEPVARAMRTAIAHIKHVYTHATLPGTPARIKRRPYSRSSSMKRSSAPVEMKVGGSPRTSFARAAAT